MPKLRWATKRSCNGEIHFIIPELTVDDAKGSEEFDVVEMRRIMKKEAAKPLLLLRAE